MQPHHLFATLALALPALASASTSVLGCYSSVPSLKDEGRYTFQSQGYCEEKCQSGGFRIAALTGLQCLCGNELPPSSAQVDDDKCDTVCAGWPEDNCGGQNYFTVLSTGEYTEVSNSSSSSDSSDSSDSTPASASTAAGGIVVAPTNINPSSVPTAILTAPSSTVPSASASAIASKSVAAAAITSVSSSTSASPTMNAAYSMHAGSSVIGAAIAGLGLLL
ncbi:hypothetical protein N7448_010623 [Penicillium atrosanguineum]|uniref:Uncharacterized protein n=1 Tax=Penicillium atrosanguineum TaxID=1132637 RepID=A0A9W9GHG3_9EURO|nr:hypothetical protein N7526_010552 [Penicillium atrosanguineum]KAJ5119954.1 hypothetical protein N7448_010623 [Penicillium atrosanguineum]KAJ5299713.1 hypothetical protein N7476_011270 [Penicillium atrosanguineum]